MICSRCKIDLPESSFSKGKVRVAKRKSSYHPYCKPCTKYCTDPIKTYKRSQAKANRQVELFGKVLSPISKKKTSKHLKAKAERNAASSKRRASEIMATPKWADLEKISAVYKECELLNLSTGIVHHVDHIIPLRGETICGLHVHWNLKPIPATENLQKSNKLYPQS